MDAPFDSQIIRLRERPLGSDINVASSQLLRSLLEVSLRLYSGRAGALDTSSVPGSGFLGDAFMVVPLTVPAQAVVVKQGLGFAYSPTDVVFDLVSGWNDQSAMKPLSLTEDLTLAVPPCSPAMTRVDRVEVTYDRHFADPRLIREVLDPTTGEFSDLLVDKTLSWNLNDGAGYAPLGSQSTKPISYKVGLPVAAGPGLTPPVPPAPTPGYMQVALINVANLTGNQTVAASSIADLRRQLCVSNVGSVGIAFDISTSSRSRPTLGTVQAPPGLQLGVLAGSDFAHGAFSLYIFGPLVNASAGASVGDGSAGAVVQPPVSGVVDSALQALLRSFAVGSIPGVGAPYLRIDGQALAWPGGSIEATVPFHVQVSCQW